MIAVPLVTPVTKPVDDPILTFALLLLQFPPTLTSDKMVVEPTHTTKGPLMGLGSGLTEMIIEVKQPVGKV